MPDVNEIIYAVILTSLLAFVLYLEKGTLQRTKLDVHDALLQSVMSYWTTEIRCFRSLILRTHLRVLVVVS